MNYDVLIIIDMQNALMEKEPYNKKAVVANIKALQHAFRTRKIPIVYIQHDGGTDDELERGSIGWEIDHEIAPVHGEKIVEKRYNSAFRNTRLKEYLDEIGAVNIILCGMQTEYCVDATCKVAFEYHYHVTIPRAATTTFDNTFASGKELSVYYENKIWQNRYAQVLSTEQIIAQINSK